MKHTAKPGTLILTDNLPEGVVVLEEQMKGQAAVSQSRGLQSVLQQIRALQVSGGRDPSVRLQVLQ